MTDISVSIYHAGRQAQIRFRSMLRLSPADDKAGNGAKKLSGLMRLFQRRQPRLPLIGGDDSTRLGRLDHFIEAVQIFGSSEIGDDCSHRLDTDIPEAARIKEAQ